MSAAAATTITLADFCIGVLGNWVARHLDPAKESLGESIYNRLSSDSVNLPPNHDVARACRDSLQQALLMMAQAMELKVYRPKTLVEAFGNRRDEAGQRKPMLTWWSTEHGKWFDEFVREIQSDESLQKFRLEISEAASLNHSLRTRTDATTDAMLEDRFRRTLIDWTERCVQTGKRPECFDEFVQQGWPIEVDKPTVRVTLYQVWCLFLQDHVKKNDAMFRILTVDWLTSIHEQLKDRDPTLEEMVTAVQEPLGELSMLLVPRLADLSQRLSVLEQNADGLNLSIGELLQLGNEFRTEVGEHFELLYNILGQQSRQLANIRDNTTKSLENDDVIIEKLKRLTPHANKPWPAPHETPPAAATTLYGRKKEFNKLKKRLLARENTAVVGPAGYGKTALAAKAVAETVGKTGAELAVSPYPDGVVFIDMYTYRGNAEAAWHKLANALQGPDFYETSPAKVRATKASLNRRALVIVEGAEEADGQDGRVPIAELLSVLYPATNRYLLLTRVLNQATVGETIRLDKPLTPHESGQLLDKLTRNCVQKEIRARLLDLLDGHPLALTWAGGLLARQDEDPNHLATDWESDPTRSLSDPVKSEHTLQWLFERSVRGLDNRARRCLSATGLLARAPLPIALIDAVLSGSSREPIKRLIDRGLLRYIENDFKRCEFTHVLGYRFARDEQASDGELRDSFANAVHQQLLVILVVKSSSHEGLTDLLQHAAALLRTDHDQRLYWPLANYLLYDGCNRLVSLGRLDRVTAALDAVRAWFDRFPTEKTAEAIWQRERSVVFNRLGDLATAQGNLPEAQRLFSESLRIAQRLAESDPANAEWQRDLSVSFNRLGDLATAQGNLPEAQRLFGESLRIAQLLTESDPANAEWQRDLSVSFNKLGDLATAQGNLPEAQRLFGESLRIRQRLAESDPANAEWQRDLSVSFNRLGDLATAQGNLPEAQRLFGESLRIAQLLAESDPANAQGQRDLWVSYWRIANVMERQNLPEASDYWQNALVTLERMMAAGLFVSEQDLSVLSSLRSKVQS
jgi:tetratricopeptide (TPR) repeat protein